MSKKLTKKQDAFGYFLQAHLDGRPSHELVERDDGYIEATSSFTSDTYFSEYDDWKDILKQAVDLAGGKVLDVGTGAGRHALYLQGKRLDVTGIDNSPLAVEIARNQGLKSVKLLSIEDIDELEGENYDTVLMLGHNFGLFGSKRKARNLLKKFEKITSEHAVIIAESSDPYETDNPYHLQYHKENHKKGRMSGQVKLRVRFATHKAPWRDYLFVSREEMKEILKPTNWEVKKFIDSEESASYAAVIKKVDSRQ